jgi:hypothetical protein
VRASDTLLVWIGPLSSTSTTGLAGLPGIGPSGHRACRASGHPGIGPAGHRAIRASGHRDDRVEMRADMKWEQRKFVVQLLVGAAA